MLRILQASEEIRTVIDGVLLKEYNLSEGKLRVMGSVSQYVLLRASCPVLIVK